LVDDSKVVYSPARGLHALETGVHAALGNGVEGRLDGWLRRLCAEGHADLAAEPWYQGDSALPAVAAEDELTALALRFEAAATARGIAGWRARCVVVCPPHFNSLVESAGTKGSVLAHALA